jgi:hypothetical protein
MNWDKGYARQRDWQLSLNLRVYWRRRRDSNPRDPFESNGFQDRRIQPLCHSSTLILLHLLATIGNLLHICTAARASSADFETRLAGVYRCAKSQSQGQSESHTRDKEIISSFGAHHHFKVRQIRRRSQRSQNDQKWLELHDRKHLRKFFDRSLIIPPLWRSLGGTVWQF